MCAYLIGQQFRGPYRGAYIQPPYISAVYMNVSRKGIKKRELCEKFPLDVNQTSFQLTYEHTTSKDSQFLEVL